MEKFLFEQMGGTYTQVGDYLLPNITISKEASKPIGVWCQRRLRYLKQHHKVLCEFEGVDKQTGEVTSIMRELWETQNNLNELLSKEYTFAEKKEKVIKTAQKK